ncbi:MAG TPA: SRPBCC family protein [Bacteroidales bacterium]
MKKFKLFLIAVICTGAVYGQKMNVEVNPKASTYNIDSVRINAPVEKVYGLLAGINDWPKWFEGVSEVHMDGNAEEGKTFVWKAKGHKINSKIHTVRLNSDIGWTGKMWWIKAVHNWHFESEPNGSTKVIVQENFNGFGSSLMKKSLKKDMRNDLLCLKKESEK